MGFHLYSDYYGVFNLCYALRRIIIQPEPVERTFWVVRLLKLFYSDILLWIFSHFLRICWVYNRYVILANLCLYECLLAGAICSPDNGVLVWNRFDPWNHHYRRHCTTHNGSYDDQQRNLENGSRKEEGC